MSYEERLTDAMSTVRELSKWCHCNHTKDDLDVDTLSPNAGSAWSFDGTIESAIERENVPEWVGPSNLGSYDTYTWQCFTEEIIDAALRTREENAERLEELRYKLEYGVGKPTTTDGSKGQWRSALTSKIRTLEWLLEE